MADQDVSDLQKDRLQRNFTRTDEALSFISSHPVCSGRNLDWAILLINAKETKTHYEHVRGQREVREFSKKGTLIVDVFVLVLRASHRGVATPLIGYCCLTQCALHDLQDTAIEKELRREDRRAKWRC
jgi:hypothetical protein